MAGRVLIVDDSPLFRSYMRTFFQKHYMVRTEQYASISDLREQLPVIEPDEIVLMIIDLRLPDGHGLPVIYDYLNKKQVSKIPFIVAGGRLDRQAAIAARQAGARSIALKPVNMRDLVNRIDALIPDRYKIRGHKVVMKHYREISVAVKRARRAGYPLSFILTGLFTKTKLAPVSKDRQHGLADRLERELPVRLQGLLRETDTVFNMAAGEYLICLSFTARSGVPVVVEKIKKGYREIVSSQARLELLPVLSTATFPDHGRTAESIIDRLEGSFKRNFSTLYKDCKE